MPHNRVRDTFANVTMNGVVLMSHAKKVLQRKILKQCIHFKTKVKVAPIHRSGHWYHLQLWFLRSYLTVGSSSSKGC